MLTLNRRQHIVLIRLNDATVHNHLIKNEVRLLASRING